jgi:hypothetical protein
MMKSEMQYTGKFAKWFEEIYQNEISKPKQ